MAVERLEEVELLALPLEPVTVMSSMKKLVIALLSVVARKTSLTVWPAKAERSYAALCSQLLLALRFESVARVVSVAPVAGFSSVTASASYTVVEVLSAVSMWYQKRSDAPAGIVTVWYRVSEPLLYPPSQAYHVPACASAASW